MQQPQIFPASGKTSLALGFSFGLGVGAIDIIYTIILNIANPPFLTNLSQALLPLGQIPGNVVYVFIASLPIYLLLFLSFLLAGIFASRKTKKVSTGVLAGMWVGVLFLVLDLFVATILVYYVITAPQLAQQGASASTANYILIFSLIYSIVNGLMLIGIGAGVGALGGLIGKVGGTPAQAYAFPAPGFYQPGVGHPYAGGLNQAYPGQPYVDPNLYPPPGQEEPVQVPPPPPA